MAVTIQTSGKKQARLLGFGMTLLDIIVDTSQDFLNKYNLPANGEARVSESDELYSIFEDVSKTYQDKMHFRPGGATVNTVKVAQWYLKEAGSTALISCVSDDLTGDTLQKAVDRAGVRGLFQVKPGLPTGSCLVLCTGSNRYLVTYCGTSSLLSAESLHSDEAKAAIKASQFFYCSGYMLIGCYDAVHSLAQHGSSSKGKVFTLNMAATFVCEQYAECFQGLLPFVDVLIGNETEARTLALALGLQTDTIEEIALKLSARTRQGEKRQPRVVVITQGALPAVLTVGKQVRSFPAPSIPHEEIVDANGAGDGFAGGFLSSLMKQTSSESEQQTYDYAMAVQDGHEAAAVILRQRGCHLPQ